MLSLYISDLDKTLLNEHGKLTDYTQTSLIELLNAGLPFSVASARGVISIRDALKNIPIQLPIIALDGAVIANFKTGEHLLTNSLDPKDSSTIFEFLKRNNYAPFISAFNESFVYLTYEKTINPGMRWYAQESRYNLNRRVLKKRHLEDSLNDKVLSFTVIDKKRYIVKIIKFLNKKFDNQIAYQVSKNQAIPNYYYINILHPKSSKGDAIKWLKEYSHLQDHISTVFGDHYNDTEMFQIADRAFAPENAVPEIKKLATGIIDHHSNDPVIKFIFDDLSKDQYTIKSKQ